MVAYVCWFSCKRWRFCKAFFGIVAYQVNSGFPGFLAAFWFTSTEVRVWAMEFGVLSPSNVFKKWSHLKEATARAWTDKWFYFLWHLSYILLLFCIDLIWFDIIWYFDLVVFIICICWSSHPISSPRLFPTPKHLDALEVSCPGNGSSR